MGAMLLYGVYVTLFSKKLISLPVFKRAFENYYKRI